MPRVMLDSWDCDASAMISFRSFFLVDIAGDPQGAPDCLSIIGEKEPCILSRSADARVFVGDSGRKPLLADANRSSRELGSSNEPFSAKLDPNGGEK